MSETSRIRFVDPQPFWADIVPTLLEAFLRGTMTLDTAGSEANIPLQGKLMALFAPHLGWAEVVAVDACFQRAGRAYPLWVTKGENRGLPRFWLGNRFIALDRDHPEPSVVRALYQVLQHPTSKVPPALGSSIEGTRFGNPDDRDDLRTLGRFQTGLVRIAVRTGTPILPVVVLGTDQIIPRLEETWDEVGTRGTLKVLAQQRRDPKPVLARCLPVYRDHVEEEGQTGGRRLRERVEGHARRLGEIMVAQIQELEPGYPLHPEVSGLPGRA
jgi:1-acyl-sn-glycerol-3-phosphate acyltransferase